MPIPITLSSILAGTEKIRDGSLFRYPTIDEKIAIVKEHLDKEPHTISVHKEVLETTRIEMMVDLESRIFERYKCGFQEYIENFWKVNEYYTPPAHFNMSKVTTEPTQHPLIV